MKILKKLLPAVALMAIASSAQAQTTILHIAGSTAYRSAVHNAIANLMTHGSTHGQAAYIGSNLAGASYATFVGTITGVTGTVEIETFWSGSISGQNTLVNNPTTITWLDPGQVPNSGADAVPGGQTGFITHFSLSPGAGGGVQIASSGNPTGTQIAPAAIADFALSDAFQGSGPFKASTNQLAGVTAAGALNPSSSNGNGIGEEVGIIPFVWMKGAANSTDTDIGTWQNLTNITNDQAKFMLGNNSAPASLLTGISTDSGVTLLITGRDGDSGTRLDSLAESAYGIFNTTDQYTFAITASSKGSSDVAGASLSDANDFTFGLQPNVVPGNNVGGYNSGGSLAKAMSAFNQDAFLGGYIIGYLGVADADTILAPNGKADGSTGNPTLPPNYVNGTQLTFNGAGEGLNSINNGQYSFWTYEHFFARPSTETVPSGSQTYTSVPALLAIAGKIVSDLESTDANVAGYRKSQVGASRTVEGGVIAP